MNSENNGNDQQRQQGNDNDIRHHDFSEAKTNEEFDRGDSRRLILNALTRTPSLQPSHQSQLLHPAAFSQQHRASLEQQLELYNWQQQQQQQQQQRSLQVPSALHSLLPGPLAALAGLGDISSLLNTGHQSNAASSSFGLLADMLPPAPPPAPRLDSIDSEEFLRRHFTTTSYQHHQRGPAHQVGSFALSLLRGHSAAAVPPSALPPHHQQPAAAASLLTPDHIRLLLLERTFSEQQQQQQQSASSTSTPAVAENIFQPNTTTTTTTTQRSAPSAPASTVTFASATDGSRETATTDDRRNEIISNSSSAAVAVSSANTPSRRRPAPPAAESFQEESMLTGRPPVVLHTDLDEYRLTPYQCMARKNMEYFEATQKDIEGSAQGRNRAIVLGQVGIRCRHCRHLPRSEKAAASAFFPGKLSGIYQACQNIANSHIIKDCPHIPKPVRTKMQLLTNRKSAPGGGRQYWSEEAEKARVFEDEHGLRFLPSIKPKSNKKARKNEKS